MNGIVAPKTINGHAIPDLSPNPSTTPPTPSGTIKAIATIKINSVSASITRSTNTVASAALTFIPSRSLR